MFFFDHANLNWDSAYQAYLPKVLAAKNVYAYWQVLSAFASLLKDGHTAVGTVDYFWKDMGPSPVFLKKVKGRHFVYWVTEALSKDIPLSTEVVAIDGLSVDSFQKVKPYNFLRGTVLRYSVRTPAGNRAEKDVEIIIGKSFPRWVSDGDAADEGPVFDAKFLQDSIYYIRLNTFANDVVVHKFESVVASALAAKPLIVDVRNNDGGNSDYARKIAEHLVDKNYTVGSSWKSRVHRSANKAWGSRILYNRTDPEVRENEAYFKDNAWEYHPGDTVFIDPSIKKLTLPVVVLIGPNTFSAAEDFLIFLDGARNITTMGSPTAGSSGQPLIIALPHGMLGRVCAKRDTYPDGREFINIGVQPAIAIRSGPRVNKGVDNVLEEAIAYLQQRADKRAGTKNSRP